MTITDKGRAVAIIVVSQNAIEPEKTAAAELADDLDQVTRDAALSAGDTVCDSLNVRD